ncbi:MAG: hotdog domain-containing protein [Actinomycetes bacterium]
MPGWTPEDAPPRDPGADHTPAPDPGGSPASASLRSGLRPGHGQGRRVSGATGSDPRLGLTVTQRRYVPYAHAHYGGDLVDGAYVLGLFGDAATELSIRTDADEGLFASYDDVQFTAAVRAGDVVEVSATVTRVGRRSRGVTFEARVVCRAEPDRGPSAAAVLDPPLVVTTASGTVVVPG